MTTRSGLLALAAAVLAAASAAALQLPPETSQTRQRLRDLILGPPAQLRWVSNKLFGDDGHPVRFETSREGDFTHYFFLNQAPGGDFPTVWEGNAWVTRNASDGKLLGMTVLLRRDSGSYLFLRPAGGRVRMEAWLYGVQVVTNVMIPIGFEEALGASLERLADLTGERVDWDLLAGTGEASAEVGRVLARARSIMPRLRDEDDGAFDASGRPVLIATGKPSRGGLNCSGFAKWIMDGFYRPLTGRYMDIPALKAKDLTIRGNRFSERYEDSRDPFFGLDWTRNMAVALNAARTGRGAGAEDFDVRSVPYMDYVEDVGYPIDRIELALYLLAREEPDRIFLGSIDRDFGQSPVLRQHTHVVVFFPQFGGDGQFRVTVLERNLETGLAGLRARYPESHVHLVQVPAGGEFAPLDPAAPRR